MDRNIRDQAILLRTAFLEPRSQILTAITKNSGMIRVVAKNSVGSRRWGNALSLFSVSDWIFYQKRSSSWGVLVDADAKYFFEPLRKSYAKLCLASAFNESFLCVVPEQIGLPDFFRLHAHSLLALCEQEEAEENRLFFLNMYLSKLLLLMGNHPEWRHCLGCFCNLSTLSLEDPVQPFVAEGGWLCPRCSFEETSFPAGILWYYKKSLQLPIRKLLQYKISSSHQRLWFEWLNAHLHYHVPGWHSLKSLAFLLDEKTSHSQIRTPRSATWANGCEPPSMPLHLR
jgi:DNA repair protein RecO